MKTGVNDILHVLSLTQQEVIRVNLRKNFYLSTAFWGSCLLFVMMCCSSQVFAQEDLERPPEIPPIDAEEQPLPPKVQDEQIEPTVTIREEEDRRIEEYRRNGQVYMVRIVPKVGLPYYYVDTDGDGNLETTPNDGFEPVKPVHWKVKEWQ